MCDSQTVTHPFQKLHEVYRMSVYNTQYMVYAQVSYGKVTPSWTAECIMYMIIIKTEDCKTEMLVMWLRQTREASWSTVVRALVGIRKGALAQKVALEYG